MVILSANVYNQHMIVSFDFVLQIMAISTSLGAVIVISYLNHLIHNKKLLTCLLMILSYTINYLTGIIAYLVPVKNIQTPVYNILMSFQLISVLFIIEFTRRVIESIGIPRFKFVKPLSRIFFIFPLMLFLAFQFSSDLYSKGFTDLPIFFLGIILWIDLLFIQTESRLYSAVKKTALIGYGLTITAYILQSLLTVNLPIRFIDALFFIFLTFSSLIFSVYYLIHQNDRRDGEKSEKTLQQQYGLTDRELEVMKLLIKSSSYKDIGSSLGISMATVKTHVSRVYRKTETNGRSEVKFRFSEK